MPTPIVMPQMGESIVEGTIVRWIKKVGDHVDRDEPLFEISTDKVDAEIPSPSEGVLTEILAREGDTVSVDSVVGTIQVVGEQPGASLSRAESQPTDTPSSAPVVASVAVAPVSAVVSHEAAGGEARRQKSSPVVRRMAREHNVDITGISGSGLGGRVTKQDVLAFLEAGESARESGGPRPGRDRDGRVESQPLSAMRKKIAEHMLLSKRTSAHVHTVFHVDFSNVERIRRAKRVEYERLGVKLSYMAFIARAVIDALRKHPIVNAALDGDSILYKHDVHLGIAVALDTGLIVPVIKNADERNLLGLTRAVAESFVKLLAVKDEYEIARLYISDEFTQGLAQQFATLGRVRYLLAPPLLGNKKRRFGPWMKGAFHLLSSLRFLRNSWFDPFAYTAERRRELWLIEHFESIITELIAGLSLSNHATAVDIAKLPQSMRGFGHVKQAQVDVALARERELLEVFRQPPSPVHIIDPRHSEAA